MNTPQPVVLVLDDEKNIRSSIEIAPRMFDPYLSGKVGKDNMGLGLAIVKKVVLEHGGDIRYRPREGHPEFVITLPGGAA